MLKREKRKNIDEWYKIMLDDFEEVKKQYELFKKYPNKMNRQILIHNMHKFNYSKNQLTIKINNIYLENSKY